MLEQYIGFGRWSKFYNYIVFLIIFSVIQDISLDYCELLNPNGILRNLYKYFGYIFFGFIFFVTFRIRLDKMTTKQDLNKKTEKIINKNDAKLIYNDKRKSFAMRNIDIIFLIVVCLIYVVNSEISKILNYLDFYSLDLWTMDIFFILILMNYYFPQSTYKHRTTSMLFIAIINTILLFLATFCKIYNNKSEDKYQNIYKYKGTSLCFIFFFIYTFTSFLIFFGRVYGKLLMEKHFISPYRIIIIIGILGFILNLIIALIFKNKSKNENCPKINDEDRGRFPNLYCYLDVNDYFSNFSKIKVREIFLTLFYIIFSFLNIMCELFVIKYLNPNFLLMSDNLRYMTKKIISFCISKNKSHLLIRFIIILFSDIFEFLGCLIYVELIELRFCGLNLNLKRKIMERSQTEAIEGELLDIKNDDDNNLHTPFNDEEFIE